MAGCSKSNVNGYKRRDLAPIGAMMQNAPPGFEPGTIGLRIPRSQQDKDIADSGLRQGTDSIGALLCALSAADLSATAKAGIKAIIETDRGND
jgi:hypothetical protein